MEATKAELERAVTLGIMWAAQNTALAASPKMVAHVAARVAERILSERTPAPPAPAKRKAAPKEPKPASWSAGAWAHYQAAQRAKSHASLAPDKLAASAMTALDKSEEIRPPLHFSALLYAGRHEPVHGFAGHDEGAKHEAPGAALELSKLGVSADLVRWETAEEYARYQLRQEYRSAKSFAHQHPVNINGRPDPYLSKCYSARTVAVKLLSAGLRDEARDLLRTVRQTEREVTAKLGRPALRDDTFAQLNPITREEHRARRRAEREERACVHGNGPGAPCCQD